MKTNTLMRAPLAVGLLGVTLAGCGDILTVSDPQRYTSEDLDNSLDAVISGVEGDLYEMYDELVVSTGLLSDELQHSGTWADWDDLDHGRIIYSNTDSDGEMDDLLRVRYFAQASQERFDRVLEGASATSPYSARAQAVEAWTDLLLAQNFCEIPGEQGGGPVTDEQLLDQAIAGMTAALQTAQAAGRADVAMWAQAGRARANLLAGNYAAALSDAQAIPTDFSWEAQYTANTGRQENSIVNLSTAGFNRASSVRTVWWPLVDVEAKMIRDPFTGELDPRVAINYDGALGVDGVTAHYSQWKYQDKGSNIQMVSGHEMRLIEAEVAWRNGQLPTALAKINELRALVGLSPHPATGDADQVFEYLLHARFAELFLEAQRLSDLHRFGLVDDFIAAGVFGPETRNPRPTKFPISELEVLNNPNFTDKSISARCLPLSS